MTDTMWYPSLRGYARFTAGVHLLLFIVFLSISASRDAPARLLTISTKTIGLWVPESVNISTNPYIESQLVDGCSLMERAQTHRVHNYSTPIVIEGQEIDTRYMIVCFHLLSFLFQYAAMCYPHQPN